MSTTVSPAPWNDSAAIARNRELMHAPWGAHTPTSSPWHAGLDGKWSFYLAPCPEAAPAGFERPDFDDTAWGPIMVPGNWELQGHGEPLYCNIAYPFPSNPPLAPADNPTGCYRTTFEIPAAWDGKRIFLEFGSVDSCFTCWVNGNEVGWSTDSKLPASFDITALVQSGRNHLAVRVCRWGASAYLEKQDYWHLSGIQRGVRLIAKPLVHLRDWCVRTSLDESFTNATVEVRAWISRPPGDPELLPGGTINYPAVRGWSMVMTLLDADGHEVARAEGVIAERSPMYPPASDGVHQEAFSAAATLVLPTACAWSAETPYLYTLVLQLRNPQGEMVDVERTRVGVRQVDIVEGILRINGRRLVVRGVNRHEFGPHRGRAVTAEDMRADIVRMKCLNFNAVRTCHYPDAEALYELCDELGMYVVDEANLETHGLEALLSRDPAWAAAFLERGMRMVLRDRNHACVICWSLGNESFWGANQAAMAGWIRAADPTRPVQYESGYPGKAITDILAPMYPEIAWIRRELANHREQRPMVMCEYAYAKGNSTGNFRKFWELVWESPRFQGGFVWDWRDKALAVNDPTAPRSVRWRYGTPRWEEAGVERMCLTGVVGPDLVEHPGAWEIKHHQAPVYAWATQEDAAAGRVQLANRYQFLDLSHLRCRWELLEEGRVVTSGMLQLPALAAGNSATLAVPISPPGSGTEGFLNLHFILASDTPWAPAGHEVYAVQLALPYSARSPSPPPTSMSAVALEEREDRIELGNAGCQLVVSRSLAAIQSWRVAGREMLSRPVLPTVMRAPTDIDRAIGETGFFTDWRRCGLDRLEWRAKSVAAQRLESSRVLVQITGELAADGASAHAHIEQTWILDGNGELRGDILADISAPVPTVPRVGLVLGLPGATRELTWYGRGPHENYPDRQDSARVGIYRAMIPEMLTPYVFPQECGLRTEVRWAELSADIGPGLSVYGEPLVHCSALPVRAEDLRDYANLADLRQRDETTLHIDGFHMGVGGDNGWSRTVHPEYQLSPGRYRFQLRLRALSTGA